MLLEKLAYFFTLLTVLVEKEVVIRSDWWSTSSWWQILLGRLRRQAKGLLCLHFDLSISFDLLSNRDHCMLTYIFFTSFSVHFAWLALRILKTLVVYVLNLIWIISRVTGMSWVYMPFGHCILLASLYALDAFQVLFLSVCCFLGWLLELLFCKC